MIKIDLSFNYIKHILNKQIITNDNKKITIINSSINLSDNDNQYYYSYKYDKEYNDKHYINKYISV